MCPPPTPVRFPPSIHFGGGQLQMNKPSSSSGFVYFRTSSPTFCNFTQTPRSSNHSACVWPTYSKHMYLANAKYHVSRYVCPVLQSIATPCLWDIVYMVRSCWCHPWNCQKGRGKKYCENAAKTRCLLLALGPQHSYWDCNMRCEANGASHGIARRPQQKHVGVNTAVAKCLALWKKQNKEKRNTLLLLLLLLGHPSPGSSFHEPGLFEFRSRKKEQYIRQSHSCRQARLLHAATNLTEWVRLFSTLFKFYFFFPSSSVVALSEMHWVLCRRSLEPKQIKRRTLFLSFLVFRLTQLGPFECPNLHYLQTYES